MINPGLAGKTVLVTGANHGIGAATARAFAAQDANVFLTYYHPPTEESPAHLEKMRRSGEGGPELYHALQMQPVENVLESIRSAGGQCAAQAADLSDPTCIPELFDRCEAEFGSVDILVNNHTHCVLETFDPDLVTGEGFPVSLVSKPVIDDHFIINSRAVALLMREYVSRYLERGASSGRIVNLSTDAAHAHIANVSYAASKHAIESYSRSAAAELGRYGITVNVVAPGPIQTGYITPEQERDIAAGTPLGRLGSPHDVADVILFLASDQARWLTGQLFYVGGGWRMSQ
jgi:3-oxoacyl-[acyl-carrier protein] reductase